MFKDSFKYYKMRKPAPNFKNVINFNNPHDISCKITKIEGTEEFEGNFMLKPSDKWEIFGLTNHPGLIFIRNPFTNSGQRYWAIRCLRDFPAKPSKTNLDINGAKSDSLLEKLRWVTFGYHHNWDTKVYSEENKCDFPVDLAELSSVVAKILGFSYFKAEAAIVNYYHMDSTLSGHTDCSEENLEAPLLSFSFGQTAVFLLGGKTRDEKPSAMFLHSGDIVVMSKEARLCYHGVPRIMCENEAIWDNFEDFEDDFCKSKDLWRPFGDYLCKSRININVRQVLNKGQKKLCKYDEKT